MCEYYPKTLKLLNMKTHNDAFVVSCKINFWYIISLYVFKSNFFVDKIIYAVMRNKNYVVCLF